MFKSELLSFSWLGRQFLKITFTDSDIPELDIEEIRQLLDEDAISSGDYN